MDTGLQACALCRFAEPVEGGAGDGLTVCRRRAPVAGAGLPAAVRGWPVVYPSDRCGEFERAYRPE